MDILQWLAPAGLAGKTAFISGGSSGINLGIGRVFARLGAKLGICARSRERLMSAEAELSSLGAQVNTSCADVRDYEAVAKALAASEQALGPADILICGAAGNFVAPAEKMSANGFRAVVDIDLLGSFNTARAAFDQLSRTRGSILFISAAQSFQPFLHQTHVGAAKAGVDQLMRGLALEWSQFGIRCNSIVPGPIENTEGMRRLTEKSSQESWLRSVPLGRFGRAEEIGALAAVLCSPLAAFVTGAQIVVDGGTSLAGSGFFNRALQGAAPIPP